MKPIITCIYTCIHIISNWTIVHNFEHISLTLSHCKIKCLIFSVVFDNKLISCLVLTYIDVKMIFPLKIKQSRIINEYLVINKYSLTN